MQWYVLQKNLRTRSTWKPSRPSSLRCRCCRWPRIDTISPLRLQYRCRWGSSRSRSGCSPSSSGSRKSSELRGFRPRWWSAEQGSPEQYRPRQQRKLGRSWWSATHLSWVSANPAYPDQGRFHRQSRSMPSGLYTSSRYRDTGLVKWQIYWDFLRARAQGGPLKSKCHQPSWPARQQHSGRERSKNLSRHIQRSACRASESRDVEKRDLRPARTFASQSNSALTRRQAVPRSPSVRYSLTFCGTFVSVICVR